MLVKSPLNIALIFEHRNEDDGVRPGVLDALLTNPEIPNDTDSGSDEGNQIKAQFHDLVRANIKAGNQEINTDSKHGHSQHDKNMRTLVLVRAVVLTAAILVAVVTDHWAKLK